MYRFLWGCIAFALGVVHDLSIEIPDFFRIIRKQHLKVLHSSGPAPSSKTDYSKTALVAISSTAESIPFTMNLLISLRQLGFHIIVLSTKTFSDETAQLLLQNCDRVIERLPIGRDFGSYQLGLRLLKQSGVYDRIETLVLANDSMFYQAGFSSIAAAVIGSPTWGGLFENYHYHYHVGGFFQMFGGEVLRSREFQRFWNAYRPVSSRKHAINKGEVGLTRAMQRAGFRPTVYYTSNRIINSFLAEIESCNDLSRLCRVLLAQFGEEYALPTGQSPRDPLRDPDAVGRLVYLIAKNVEQRNPTHGVGLLANVLCGAPIKRDIAYRAAVTIGEILQFASGYTASEMTAMEMDLRARGSPAMFHGIRKILYLRGNL